MPLTETPHMKNTAGNGRKTCAWVLASLVAVVFVAAVLYGRAWNARNRPPILVGTWYHDDLRTEERENAILTFSQVGEFNYDDTFGMRWRFSDGKLFIRYWGLDLRSKLARKP